MKKRQVVEAVTARPPQSKTKAWRNQFDFWTTPLALLLPQ